MAVTAIEEVLKINMVLLGAQLLSNPEARSRFREEVGVEVSEDGPPIPILSGLGMTFGPPGKLSLPRERITIELPPVKTTISREYPSHTGLKRLAQVAKLAIELSPDVEPQDPWVFGFNIELVCGLSQSAGHFMTTYVFRPSRFGGFLRGGTARLNFILDDQSWTLSLEPRFGDFSSERLYMGLNMHYEGNELPSESRIAESLDELWNQGHAIVDKLSRRE